LPLPLPLSFPFFLIAIPPHSVALFLAITQRQRERERESTKKKKNKNISFYTFFEGECGFGLQECEELFLSLALYDLRLQKLENSGCSPQQYLPASKPLSIASQGVAGVVSAGSALGLLLETAPFELASRCQGVVQQCLDCPVSACTHRDRQRV
jgi:hypothetical protein